MNKKFVFGAALFGLISLVGAFGSHIYFFLTAYLTEEKITEVNINRYGEANLELFLFLVAVPCVVFFFLSALRFLHDDWYKGKEVVEPKKEEEKKVEGGCDCAMCKGGKK